MDPDPIDKEHLLWEKRSGTPLTQEEMRQIREGLSGFFETLLQWQAASRGDAPREPNGEADRHERAERDPEPAQPANLRPSAPSSSE